MNDKRMSLRRVGLHKLESFLASSFWSLGLAAMIATCVWSATPTWAATNANASSPLGINLNGVSYFTPEQPFLDVFKTNAGFSTNTSSGAETNEEQYLNLDSNGWPKTLTSVNEPGAQKFAQLQILLLRSTSTPLYASGQYIVRYQGEGTITYQFDGVKDTSQSTPGRDVINVANATQGGINLIIKSTDPNHTGNYIRNIQVVRAEQESSLIAGQMFNPVFTGLLQNFRVLRFMDWLKTNGSNQTSWANRSLPTNATWAAPAGVPYEVIVNLANTLGADPWVNVPLKADDDYITQLATLMHAQLGTSQKVYVELSNETWNSGFSQTADATTAGAGVWPSLPGYLQNRYWYGMRTAQMCDIWKSVWGNDFSRVVCVLAGQAGNPSMVTLALDCKGWSGAPCAAHNIGAVAIAPYFGPWNALPAWTSQPDGGLSSLFGSLTTQNDPVIPAGGFVNQALGWVAAYPALLAKYKLPLISYEGGQSFVSFPRGVNSDGSNNALTNLYIAANRDPRMQAAYQAYLEGWKAAGGQLFVHFSDISGYGQFGEWGALESIMQTTTPLSGAPPKWQALQNFIAGKCWWPGCTGAVGSTTPTPMAPSNLKVVR